MQQKLPFKAYTFTTHKDVSVSEIVSRSQRSMHCNESYVERKEEEQLPFRQDKIHKDVSLSSSPHRLCGPSVARHEEDLAGRKRETIDDE